MFKGVHIYLSSMFKREGGCVRINPNIVRILKSAQINGPLPYRISALVKYQLSVIG